MPAAGALLASLQETVCIVWNATTVLGELLSVLFPAKSQTARCYGHLRQARWSLSMQGEG